MLQGISWNQYFVFTGIAAAGWYGYALLRYAGRSSTNNNRTLSSADRTGLFVTEEEKNEGGRISPDGGGTHPTSQEEQPDFALVAQTVTGEIKAVIDEAADQGISDAELAAQLRVILSNYVDLHHTAHWIAVNDYIIREGTAAGFRLAKDEVKGFWE